MLAAGKGSLALDLNIDMAFYEKGAMGHDGVVMYHSKDSFNIHGLRLCIYGFSSFRLCLLCLFGSQKSGIPMDSAVDKSVITI